MGAETPIWTPSLFRIADANLTRFMAQMAAGGAPVADCEALYRWSIDEPAAFWEAVWDFASVVGDRGSGPSLVDGSRMPGARWFPEARLNFAENLLRGPDEEPAIVFRNEGSNRRELSRGELRAETARIAAGLVRDGVGPGDVVAGFLPNVPEAVVAMLAAASIGATWTSCSPDFGVQGVLDRFGQVKPKVLFTADGYRYAGKVLDSRGPVTGVLEALPSIERVVLVPYLAAQVDAAQIGRAVGFAEYGERVVQPVSP